jgi:hypothetical protein
MRRFFSILSVIFVVLALATVAAWIWTEGHPFGFSMLEQYLVLVGRGEIRVVGIGRTVVGSPAFPTRLMIPFGFIVLVMAMGVFICRLLAWRYSRGPGRGFPVEQLGK